MNPRGHHAERQGKRRLAVGAYIVLIFIAALAAVFVFKVPSGTLFYVGLIAICPLMHLFMGHGHDPDDSSR
ncbi:MAG: DUF2933 domain-containing protein [Actinobacteria bacterium]|nr:DUF2933 domain-containing protein [Actinomycetota bacterium]